MLRLQDIPIRDRPSYFGDTIIFRVTDNKPYLILGFSEDEGEAILTAIGDHLRENRRSFNLSIREVDENYVLHRPPLGWRNQGLGCIFAGANPGRGYKKAYTVNDMYCISPIYSNILKLLEKAHDNFHSSLVREKSRSIVSELEHRVDIIQESLNKVSDLRPRQNNYLKAFQNPYVSKQEAIRSVANRFLGRAINEHWAVIQLPNNSPNRAGIFYQDTVVGSVDLTSLEPNIFNKFEELVPSWKRLQ